MTQEGGVGKSKMAAFPRVSRLFPRRPSFLIFIFTSQKSASTVNIFFLRCASCRKTYGGPTRELIYFFFQPETFSSVKHFSPPLLPSRRNTEGSSRSLFWQPSRSNIFWHLYCFAVTSRRTPIIHLPCNPVGQTFFHFPYSPTALTRGACRSALS